MFALCALVTETNRRKEPQRQDLGTKEEETEREMQCQKDRQITCRQRRINKEQTNGQRHRERRREVREREKKIKGGRKRERERQTDRQTETDRQTD